MSDSDYLEDSSTFNYEYHPIGLSSNDGEIETFPYGPNPKSLKFTVALTFLQYLTLFSLLWKYSKFRRHYFFSTILYSIKLYIIKRLNESDPGTIPTDLHLLDYLQNAVPARVITINGVNILQKWCGTCRLYKPPRTKHCYACNKCINRFDHHCPWISNCIGHNNYKLFILFVTFTMLVQHYSFLTLHSLLKELYEKDFSMFSREIYLFLFNNHFFFLLFFLLCLITSVFFTFYNAFNKYLLLTNQTTYEFTYRKYVVNPYNEGLINNIKTFHNLPHQFF